MPFNNSLHPTTASVTLCAGAQATPATLAAETIVIWKEALPENRAILFGQRCVSKTVQLILGLPLKSQALVSGGAISQIQVNQGLVRDARFFG
jgi:predicted RecB family nuclease